MSYVRQGTNSPLIPLQKVAAQLDIHVEIKTVTEIVDEVEVSWSCQRTNFTQWLAPA